jgi:hypothetical protein
MISFENPLKILFVEDNPNHHMLVKEYLKQTSMLASEVIHETKLPDAVDLPQTKIWDIIFLDLNPPHSKRIGSFILSDKDNVKRSFDEIPRGKSIQYCIKREKNFPSAVRHHERYDPVIKATMDTQWDLNFPDNEFKWDKGIRSIFGHSVKVCSQLPD